MSGLIIVAVKDRAIDAFMRPFFAQTTGQAIRMFSDEINRTDQENPLNKHPDDYDLWKLGVWDEYSGEVTSEILQLAIGKQLKGANTK